MHLHSHYDPQVDIKAYSAACDLTHQVVVASDNGAAPAQIIAMITDRLGAPAIGGYPVSFGENLTREMITRLTHADDSARAATIMALIDYAAVLASRCDWTVRKTARDVLFDTLADLPYVLEMPYAS